MAPSLTSFLGPLRARARRLALRALSRNYVLVTGSQRSGTTLMLLILDAHPRVRGLDESEVGWRAAHPTVRELLRDARAQRTTCRKLPRASGHLSLLRGSYPHARIVWMVRHPLAVVSSMRALRLEGWEGNWLALYAEKEIRQFSDLLPDDTRDVDELSLIERGARVWALNCKAVEEFRRAGMDVDVVRYEELLRSPESTLRRLLGALSLEWDPSVLAFHERERNENRVLAGGTTGAKAMDDSRAKPDVDFKTSEVAAVAAQCAPWAERYGYDFG